MLTLYVSIWKILVNLFLQAQLKLFVDNLTSQNKNQPNFSLCVSVTSMFNLPMKVMRKVEANSLIHLTFSIMSCHSICTKNVRRFRTDSSRKQWIRAKRDCSDNEISRNNNTDSFYFTILFAFKIN